MNKKELVSLIVEYGCHTREQGRYQAEADAATSLEQIECLQKRAEKAQEKGKASFDRIIAEIRGFES